VVLAMNVVFGPLQKTRFNVAITFCVAVLTSGKCGLPNSTPSHAPVLSRNGPHFESMMKILHF